MTVAAPLPEIVGLAVLVVELVLEVVAVLVVPLLGVFAGNYGHALQATHALTITLTGSQIRSGDQVVEYNAATKRFVRVPATVTDGKAVVLAKPACELAIVRPKA